MANKLGISITIDKKIKETLDAEAKRQKRSLSSFIEIICEDYIDSNCLN